MKKVLSLNSQVCDRSCGFWYSVFWGTGGHVERGCESFIFYKTRSKEGRTLHSCLCRLKVVSIILVT